MTRILARLIDRIVRRLYRPDSAFVRALEEIYETNHLNPDDSAREG